MYLLALWMVACLTFSFRGLWSWPWSDSDRISGGKGCTKHMMQQKNTTRGDRFFTTAPKRFRNKEARSSYYYVVEKRRSSHDYGDGLKQQIMGTIKNPMGFVAWSLTDIAPEKLPFHPIGKACLPFPPCFRVELLNFGGVWEISSVGRLASAMTWAFFSFGIFGRFLGLSLPWFFGCRCRKFGTMCFIFRWEKLDKVAPLPLPSAEKFHR